MRKLLLVVFVFILTFPCYADFQPLEKEVNSLRSKLSTVNQISKIDLEKSLNLLKEKASLIENEVAKSDITGDCDILLNKYVYKNEKDNVPSDEVDYWLKHIVDDLAMFRKIGIDK